MPFGSDRTGWRWKQHLNCPCIFKPAFPRQGSGIWSLCCAFCHVQMPNLSLLGYCRIAIMNLVFVCFIKVVSRQTIEYSNVLKRYHFPLNWFGCAVPPSSHSSLGGVPAGQATSTFSPSAMHIGGFQLSKPPVNLMCWFHLTLRKPIFHLLLLLWKEERDKKTATKEKEKIHQCHQFRARSLNCRARAVPAGVILQSMAAPWVCEKQFSESC